jgi:hypothetical protein
MHARIDQIVAFVLCVAALCLPPVAVALELGNVIFETAPAKLLAISREAGPSFLRLTGGIAFANEAEGRDGSVVSALRYDPAAADGSRLIVTITRPDGSTQNVTGALFDWELVPVARHAGDNNDAAFTYFGELESAEREREALAEGFRVLNYHEAFENTLIGLRLMQLDFLMISALQSDAMYLPKEAGKTLLGNGEAEYLLIGDEIEAGVRRYEQENFVRLEAFKAKADPIVLNQSYRSYVAGDYELDSPTFEINSAGELEFSGGIYWYFWNDPEAAAIETNIDLYNQMVRLYNYLDVLEGADEAPAAEEAGLSVEERARYRDYATQAINKSSDEIKKQAATLDALNADTDRDVNDIPEVSRQLNQYLREYQGLNPLILRAGDRVAWYSALFRHFKVRAPKAYKVFVERLDGVAVLPAVTTPTLVKPAAPSQEKN